MQTKHHIFRVFFPILSVVLIVGIFVLNFFLFFSARKNFAYVDLTPESLYTLTDEMKRECAFLDGLDGEVTMIFCTDPDYLTESVVSRVVYDMAILLHKLHPNFVVKTVNVAQNPTAVARYKTTSLNNITASDVIFDYNGVYRITSLDSFWRIDSSSTLTSFDGEYRLVTMLRSVTAIDQPAAYFLTGHGETVYDENTDSGLGEFAEMLYEIGLRPAVLDLSETGDIPTDCALLIVNNPQTDLVADADRFASCDYRSEAEILDRYLTERDGAIAVARDPSLSLQNLDEWLLEYGFSFEKSTVKVGGESSFLADYVSDQTTDDNAYAIYGSFVDLGSAPRVRFVDSGSIVCKIADEGTVTSDIPRNTTRTYFSYLRSPATSETYLDDLKTGNAASRDLAAVTVLKTLDPTEATHSYSYIFSVADGDYFSDGMLRNRSVANFDITAAAMKYISRTNAYASPDLGGSSLNSSRAGGKMLLSTAIVTEKTEVGDPLGNTVIEVNRPMPAAVRTLTVILITLIPLSAVIAGAAVLLRRRFL